ncbi:MAG: IS66 family insertion sequence element accessory protein TnpA [Acidiferrobacteraceae bacterium]
MAYNEEEAVARWRGLVSDQVASGKSVVAFCRERDLREWQFYEWKKRLRRSEASPFLAVEVRSPEAPPHAASVMAQIAGIELRHRRGWSLIVEAGFDAKHLRRLLSVLEQES